MSENLELHEGGQRFWGRRIYVGCPVQSRYEAHYRREHTAGGTS